MRNVAAVNNANIYIYIVIKRKQKVSYLTNCTDHNWEPVSHQSKLKIRNKSLTPVGYL